MEERGTVAGVEGCFTVLLIAGLFGSSCTGLLWSFVVVDRGCSVLVRCRLALDG